VQVRVTRDAILLQRGEVSAISFPWDCQLEVPGTVVVPGGRIVAEILSSRPPIDQAIAPNECWLPVGKFDFPLRVRSFRQGDRFHPFGDEFPTELERFLGRERIPRESRVGIPLILSGENVVWVVGVRASEHTRVHQGEGASIRLQYFVEHSDGRRAANLAGTVIDGE